MKTTFAKIVDATLGAALIFFAAYALLLYFMPGELAMFCAGSVCAAALVMLSFVHRRRRGRERVSAAAQKMFYAFLFESDRFPARLLHAGLKRRGADARLIGAGVYVQNSAAFFELEGLTAKRAARLTAIAKRHGASRVTVFCKAPPPEPAPDVDGMTVKTVHGDDVYRLFASLDALPAQRFSPRGKKKFAALRGALNKDRTARYAVLSASLFLLSAFSRSVFTLVIACIAAALFAASVVYNVWLFAKKAKPR